MARSGFDISKLTTRDQVKEVFGNPQRTLISEFDLVDEFRTRKKVSDEMRATSNGLGFAFTAGLTESFAFPREIYLLGRTTVVGEKLRIEYDKSGNITNATLNDRRLYGLNGFISYDPKPAEPVDQAESECLE